MLIYIKNEVKGIKWIKKEECLFQNIITNLDLLGIDSPCQIKFIKQKATELYLIIDFFSSEIIEILDEILITLDIKLVIVNKMVQEKDSLIKYLNEYNKQFIFI